MRKTMSWSLIILVVICLVACDSAQFKGNQSKKKTQTTPVAETSKTSGNPNITNQYQGNNSGFSQTPIASINSSGPSTQQELCLNNKADSYNITLVLDNSGSQMETDPTFIRQAGAISFVNRFASYAGKFANSQINMSVVSFSDSVFRGANGWVMLKNGAEANVISDIMAATDSPDGFTNYEIALNEARNLFAEVNIGNTGRYRNYLVFLTDGEPNRGSHEAVLNELVNTFQVAVLAVASGGAIRPEGEMLTQSMALPVVNNIQPDHIGRYIRAADPSAMQYAWDQLFNFIATCQ